MSGSSIVGSFGKDTGKKFLKDQVSSIMKRNGVAPDMQRMILFAIDNSIEYVDFCAKMNKKPDDPRVLTEFLISKGIFTMKMASDDIKCAVSLLEFANNLRKNIPKARGPIPATIVVSLTLIDLLSVGNSCTFVQEAYYHYVLRGPRAESLVKPPPSQVRRTEAMAPADPLAFLKVAQPQERNKCEVEKGANSMARAAALRML